GLNPSGQGGKWLWVCHAFAALRDWFAASDSAGRESMPPSDTLLSLLQVAIRCPRDAAQVLRRRAAGQRTDRGEGANRFRLDQLFPCTEPHVGRQCTEDSRYSSASGPADMARDLILGTAGHIDHGK